MNKYSNREKTLVFIGTVLLLCVMMLITSRNSATVGILQNVVGIVIKPVDKMVYTIGTKAQDAFVYVFGTAQMRRDFETLKQENEALKEDILLYENVISRMDFLQGEYELLKKTEYPLQTANIIAKDPSNIFVNFTIDKGSGDDVSKGDIILMGVAYTDANYVEGVVGKVEQAGSNWAKVSTIIDENQSISFKSARTMDYGVISGRGDKGLIGYAFHADADIKVGDKLITSGIGGIYPKDLYIGDVLEVKQTEEMLLQVIVETKVDFSSLSRVLILNQGDGKYESN